MTALLLRFIFIITLFFNTAFAQSIQKFADIGNFKLENGEVIKDCRIGVRTFGILNRQKSNAMLFPSWFGGTSANLLGLIGPGNVADSTKYFVIAVDALGDGVSSSPSNSKLQPDTTFPKFDIRDMVNSQYEMLTKILHINHLFCVIGGSMGGIRTFQWIVSYPNFTDYAIPWIGTPKLTFYDLLLLNTELQIINTDLKAHVPEEGIMKAIADITELNVRTPQYYAVNKKPEEFYTYIRNNQKSFSKGFKVYDWRSQLEAIIAHNVAAPYDSNMQTAASRVKAKVLEIVNLQDHMVNPHPAINFAKLIHAKLLELNNDCGHLGPFCQSDTVDKAINDFLEKK
jgi:homoserine acetyltransferase